ncbi:hypothetical protein CDAR_558921 [Caerostris darwini]|uniref:Uncharacterized protein n=1 Tax=Caerostris darwini TaxID=1538125 RepID=A0AAV4NEU8_9ARAC|nr:hypothetical protein CDAR_558921 [Caerostris darwini]
MVILFSSLCHTGEGWVRRRQTCDLEIIDLLDLEHSRYMSLTFLLRPFPFSQFLLSSYPIAAKLVLQRGFIFFNLAIIIRTPIQKKPRQRWLPKTVLGILQTTGSLLLAVSQRHQRRNRCLSFDDGQMCFCRLQRPFCAQDNVVRRKTSKNTTAGLWMGFMNDSKTSLPRCSSRLDSVRAVILYCLHFVT